MLSRFVGKKDFYSFCKDIQDSGLCESRFFSPKVVLASDLKLDTEVVIGWAPDRLVHLKYEGEDSFTVTDSENSKLLVGDKFVATYFMLGYPLYLPKILRGGEYTSSYIAGAAGGLNIVEVIKA